MASVDGPQKAAIGWTYRVTIKRKDTNAVLDISGASAKVFKWVAPNGDVDEHTAAFTTDGTDGKLEFVTTVAGDLDQVGGWKSFAHITDAGGTGYTGYTQEDQFNVLSNPD